MAEEPTDPYEYEVDLREYIEVIWREKWLVLLIFLVAAGGAYGFSRIQPPQYKTSTTLLITPRVSEQLLKNQDGGFVSSTLPTSVYRKSAMADDLLENIIKELNLRNEGDKKLSVNSLKSKLNVKIELSEDRRNQVAKLPLVTMTVTGSDSGKIKRIANKWADLFVERNTELLASETARSYEFISGRFREVSDDLNSKQQQELDYRKEHPIELLRSEVKVYKKQYREFLTQLQNKRTELKEKKARLQSLNNILEKESKFLNLTRSIPERSLWNLLQKMKYESVKQKESKSDQLKQWTGLKVEDQQVNEVYFNLMEKKSTVQADISSLKQGIDYLKGKTKELAKKIEETQFKIEGAQLKLSQLDREINRLSNTYETLSSNLVEARITKEEKESSIRVMETAVQPESPVGTNKRQNVAVAGVLGLFIGVLVAFFKNYMQDYELEEAEDEEDTDSED